MASITQKDFIEKARKIHGDKYDYSLVEYVNTKTKVKIICPIHGVFEQTPNSHMSGKGCKLCSFTTRAEKMSMTTDEFVKKAKEVHGDKYNYDKVKYVHHNQKIIITCLIHGDFEQTPSCHLQGKGCYKCRGLGLTNDEWIEEFKRVHGNKYDYSKMIYKDSKTKVTIICPIHGEFEQNPSQHKIGKGCPYCHSDNKNFIIKPNKQLKENNKIQKIINCVKVIKVKKKNN